MSQGVEGALAGMFLRSTRKRGMRAERRKASTVPGGGGSASLSLRRPLDEMAVHVERRPELAGPIELEDSETGQRLPLTLDAATVAAYRRNVAAWQEGIAASCARRGASYAQVLTDWPLERSVVPYLRARRILR